jgi:hypothetical protein
MRCACVPVGDGGGAVQSIEEFVAERDTVISCLRLYGSPSYHASEFALGMFYPALMSRSARESLKRVISASEMHTLSMHPLGSSSVPESAVTAKPSTSAVKNTPASVKR